MKTRYHKEITQIALSGFFSEDALNEIIASNIRQDRPKNQFGHDYIHFDGSTFKAGFDYIGTQEKTMIDGINDNNFSAARQALGRLTHSWQDFYSHSNYVRLWVSTHAGLPPQDIEVNHPLLIHHPDLHSGKNYGLIEFLALIPFLSPLIKPLMPEDSHAAMNLDGPETGELFFYAYQAALEQTRIVMAQLQQKMGLMGLSQSKKEAFLGK